ncbi:muscle-specific protein 300 kDa isoform X6 [Microplitis demolitor]|uniref:muscle-specific protein 300 kDa isoform X6 n=1 Tax=Microplitis demolitor TaxID=69319 RepID=UPI0004CD796D|nr:muscle-specific protein 300 kDa isoform X6 [Microplitis demolitor]
MSRQTPPKGENPKPTGSPRTPRGGRLRDRVNFFENIWSQGRSASTEDLVDRSTSPVPRRSSSRTSDSSFEESFERVVEEGELNGAKVVKFEKITVRKSVKEIVSTRSGLSEASRTPSEEHALDSAYQSHGMQGSKSSSVMSFTKFPSEENLSRDSLQTAETDEKVSSEWYTEYRNQSFQNVSSKIEYVRSRSEYDAHIVEIKDEQERVQKKTFVNWINSYLSKRVPPLRVDDLIEDLKDGTRLLALLEVLSGEKLPVERGRNLKRPHFLSNANTALQFLQSKKIKLVNINSSDLVDGRPPVVLGLIWTIILYFQIEENTRALEYLGQTWGSQSSLESLGTQSSAASERKRLSSEKWKQGARKTLLQWVTNALPKESEIQVRDFGESWRDGNAFLAVIDAIKRNLVNIAAMRAASNRARLETAFEVAEVELGIARLLDPEDVDVPQPDEKSIMTYVAQFLHKYPEPKSAAGDSFTAVQQEYDSLLAWLVTQTRGLDQMDRTHTFSSNYLDYSAARAEADEKSFTYRKLQNLVDTSSMITITQDSWRQIQELWSRMEYLLLKWLWLLDSSLPGEIGEAGRWLALAESLLNSDNDIPEEMNEQTAGIISNKLEDHKKFFLDLPDQLDKFNRVKMTSLARQVPQVQLDNMTARFDSLGDRAAKRRIKLKFLEHKCCLVAFIYLVETKLKTWGVKYGSEEEVQSMLEQYRNFVSRNRIFQEFQKAYLDMQQVADEYKREGGIDRDESLNIDKFMRETNDKWKNVSMDLRCVQSMLEEVMAYWRRWNTIADEFSNWLIQAEAAVNFPDEEKMEFFQNISVWKDKHQQLSDTVSFLIATTTEVVALHLRDRYTELTNRWERTFAEAKQYMHAGDLLRNRKDYRTGVDTLQKWLRNAESVLSTSQLTSTEKIKAYGEQLQVLNSEFESIEELFKSISKKFQTLLQDLPRDEVDKMMNTLKKEKEALVKVRALIPMQLHLYHQLLVQQESLEAGQREISGWLDEAEALLSSLNFSGGRDAVLGQLERHKAFFSRTLYYKSMLESKNKVFSSIVKSVDAHANPETAEGGAELRALNERFNRVVQTAQICEQRLQEAVRCWTKFKECERQMIEWLTAAENLISDKRIDNRQSVDNHKSFFSKVNERLIQDLINAGQDLRNTLPVEQQTPIIETVDALQQRWKDVMTFAPLHLMRLEFRLDEAAFMQYLKEIEAEVNSEQQSLIKNEDVESIIQRNKDFFVNQGIVVNVERCLQTLKKISYAYSQLKPNDTSLQEAVAHAEQLWEDSAQRVEIIREQLRQVPEQWAEYRKRYDEMVRWMDQVDSTLRTILKEVNSLEEFEKEKSIFQKVCHEADGKREHMKWLVQTLDSLTTNRSDREAITEQHQLEMLITRYKNLIPTIEITMTKTDIYTKSYTYRKEVREVCTLLRKVKEQNTVESSTQVPENLKDAVVHQETRLSHLEQQRANIVSMLQRGKDLLKDQHAPPFVSSEIQQLESNWNETYGQSIETLKSLKTFQKLWQSYQEQKEEVIKLVNSANEEMQKVKTTTYYDASQVSSDLRAKQELSSNLKKSSEEMMSKLRETTNQLTEMMPSDKRLIIHEEITHIEETLVKTIETVEKRVIYLTEHSNRWSKFQSEVGELRNWAQQSAPQAIVNIQDLSTSPEDRLKKTETLQKQIAEKIKAMESLEKESRQLVKDDKANEAKALRGQISNLQSVIDALNKDIAGQRVAATENLATWKKYEVGIQKVKPWVEQAETQAASIGTKPSTLAQATEMLHVARSFEKQCEEHLPRVQELSHVSQQITGRTAAPDEVDAVYTRWNAVHDVSIQTVTKLDKLVSSWKSFENEAEEFNRWLDQSEKACQAEPNYQTPEASKLEQDLNHLKELNKVISDRQAQLISLTQVSDHVSHGLSIEGATQLKGRVAEMKTRVGRLADTVRHHINLVSDALLARQEFQIKISDFENWMARLRTSIAEISEVNVGDVDTNLQAVHGFLQEHLEKQPNFSAIYEEVKQLAAQGSPEEAKALNEVYTGLAQKYKALEDDLQQRKKGLERWGELLNWYNETNAQLSHTKYELEARKPNIAELEKLSNELQTVYSKIEAWKDQIPVVDSLMGIHMRDKQEKPLTASSLVHELESKAVALKTEVSTKRDRLENLGARWDNFRKIQQKLTEEIVATQTTLQQITVSVDTCDKLAPAVEQIDDLIEEHQRREPDKLLLHREGENLMKEDAKATTNVQVVVSSVDGNWEKVNELLKEQRKKYDEMGADWRCYQEAREKLVKFMEDSQTLRQSTKEVPNDVTQANLALEKHKRASEVLKKGKQFLEKMDQKAQQLIKEASLMPTFKVEIIENDLSTIRNQYQDIYTTIVEKTQSYETQVIIWKQIEEAKYDLTRWLSDTNEALSSACERLTDAENGQARLARYHEELPSYQLMRQSITTKTDQLVKINHNADMPTLKSLNKLLDDQFKLLKDSADKLEALTTNLNEKEKAIRVNLKKSGDQISKIREDVIKCDDLTGENTKILSRIKKCRELQKELEVCSNDLAMVGEKIAEASQVYPAIERSSLPKELQSLQLRRDGVSNHADKVTATLVAFLTKLYHEKFTALQRMVGTLKEKVLWCEPEQSSDRYNLEVKMASLVDVETGIKDCEARKADTDKSLSLLETVESKETTSALKAERDKVADDLVALKSSHAKIKNVLQQNIALWQRYESISEAIMSWLKETEAKIRGEGSMLVELDNVEDKIVEVKTYQKTVNDYEKEMKALAQLGEDILQVSPESRAAQYVSHLTTRYQAIQKFLSQHLERLQELKDGRDQYRALVKELEKWIDEAETKLKSFDQISGPKAMAFYQSRLKELREFGESREKGQGILNKTAEAGEALFPRTTPDQREAIRAELRNLRNRVDGLIDRSNVIYKKIENDMMHRSSFEDKYTQVKQWLIDAQAKLGDKQDLLPTLQEKKLALHSYRAIAQDVSAHRNILQQLKDRLSGVSDDEASEMLASIIEGYDKLSSNVEDRIGIAEKHVANHEAYVQTLDRTRDWLNAIVNEAAPLLEDLAIERDSAKSKIAQIENLLQQRGDGDRILEDCNQQLNIILEQTSIAGHPALVKGFEVQKKIWEDFLAQCEATKSKLNRLFNQWTEFERVVEELEAWTKAMESRVKDQTLKSTEEAKQAYLQKLKGLEEEIAAKAPEFNAAAEQGQSHAESELATRISRQVTKYQAIKNQAREAVARYEQYVKEHSTFNERYNQFLNWIKGVQEELNKHREIVGDLALLQSRQKSIRDLADTRTKENPRFESVIDLGEKLYVHTSPEGREIVRQQLRNLRTLWDGFTEDLQSATQKLDQCLMQFAEFSLSQEQLTSWLRNVEKDMHQHTELKSTLEEKRAQLQNHRIMHQEIMSHQTLVESVCDKAQRLVDQTKDTSLNVYLQSIKHLFQNIVAKSQDLLDNLEECADVHNKFNLQCKYFDDWLNVEREKLLDCNDITGERADISRRLATLAVLKNGQAQGLEHLTKLRELLEVVIKSTAEKGQEAIKKEADALESALHQHLSEIETVEAKQNAALQKWQDFEEQLDVHTKWFRTIEAVFRDQQLQATLKDKEDRLQLFKNKRDIILKKEKEIDEFVDKSHGLLNASGVERIKPAISQISNRYQSLHVLSKEVVDRCRAIVDEHREFEDKLKAVDVWLTPLEQNLAALKKDELGGDFEAKGSRLKMLLAERDQATSRLTALTAAGERILPATSAQGRETIRHELRHARERWDNLTEGISEQQKKQDAQSLQWSSYQETLQHISAWLDNMERAMKQDSSTSSTHQEVRSRLLKSKTLHQEILAHKRIVEAISEKANALTQAPADVKDAVVTVSKRYESLVDASQKGIASLERLSEIFQQLHDLQKAYQDYQKQQWDKLANYNDYTGNKAALQARLAKVIEIQDEQTEGELKLNVLEKHVKQNSSNLPPRAQESTERDLANLRFESKKFATAVSDVIRSLEERIQQWSEYENALERLLAWLSEAETILKNYTLKNTIEEKQEQLEKYQELLKISESRNRDVTELVSLGDHLEQSLIVNLRSHEAEFDKMSDNSSELIETSGESRFSANVQQVTSRFQSIQATAKELVKKCEQATQDHAAYLERYKQCTDWLAASQAQYQASRDTSNATKQDLISNGDSLRELLSRITAGTLLVNNTVEAGERLYPTTGSEGREIIRQQLLDLQQALESLVDGVSSTERDIQVKISRWLGFDDCSGSFEKWLSQMEKRIKPELELKTTLDEKRIQLQIYRDSLHDIQSHQEDLLALRDKSDNLPDKTDKTDKIITDLTKRYSSILKRVQGFVEKYEAIVSDHQQYSKAVLETHEWLDATHNAVSLWGDTDLERVSLHTNIDRLKNLLHTLPEDQPRIQQIRVLGEKVIPGTLESGQVNIRSQIDSSQQEWEGLVSAIKSTIEVIENKLQQWHEFEALKEKCLDWIRDTDTKLHAVDLKSTLPEKKEQLEQLRVLQGEVRAKELEIDAVTERAQQLQKNMTSRTSNIPELGIKYQQISSKVKDLNNRWHQYVSNHQDFDNNLAACINWLEGIREKLAYSSDLSALSQKDLESKMETVQDLLLYKEDGFSKIQGIVELAQTVLANTAPAGHQAINEAVVRLQEQWSALTTQMLETKTNLDDSINKWAGLLEQIQMINKTVELMKNSLGEILPFQSTMTEKRNQLERIKALEEKVRCENIEVDNLKSKFAEMIASGQQGLAASQAQDTLNKFDQLFEKIKSLLAEREDQYKDHKRYKEAHDDLIAWLSRAREKIPSMKQRTLSDKLAVENAVAPLESLLNKKAQGELLVEHLQHTGEVVCASTSPQGGEIIRNEIRALSESFESLFKEVQHQKSLLESTVSQWRDYKDEYERLSDWLQQFDILIKAQKNALLPNVVEKEKQVKEVRDILDNLEKGQEQIDKFNKSASVLLSSHLDTYINNQLRHLNSRYQVQVNLAKDVLNKVETNLSQHQEYEANLGKTRAWIDNAKQIIRQGTEAASSSSREELQERLEKIQELLKKLEEGQNLVHLTVNCGEKVARNTRSDGREEINNQLKEIQNDWERLVKKISTTKVHLETSLLQWADYSSSYSQLQQWINDREAKLQQVCEQKVSKAKKGLAGLNSLAIGERKANLRQTNSIMQDIVAFEPMIQSVTTKAEDLQQATPATEISIKYETLSKQAQELYAKQKETVEQHQAFVDSGTEFVQWIRVAKERLGKCSEPTGDKESLSSKITQLKVLQSELPEGQQKLEKALERGNAACQIADAEDKEIIEEDVAMLQEEYDNYVDSLNNTKSLLEVGIVKWTEYEDQYSEATEWLNQTEQLVQTFNKLQDSLEEKKNVLERFQVHLQTLFDWQKELDRLNMKAQMLLETCADTRISNQVTQLTTKYNALLSLAKEIMRRLELHYQEHQQHNTLYQECQDWIDRTRDKLGECKDVSATLNEVNNKLNMCKAIRQTLEQGQNKLRYALELKERVIMNTEQNGAAKIQEDTENLKAEFDKLMVDVEDARQKLSTRATSLEELGKLYRLITDWIDEIDVKIRPDETYRNDLSEKRMLLEKYRTAQRDIQGHSDTIDRLKSRLHEDSTIPREPYETTIAKYDELRRLVAEKINNLEDQVREHERFQQAQNEAADWVRKTKVEVQQYSMTQGERPKIVEREKKISEIVDSMPKGEALISKVMDISESVISSTGAEGQDAIRQEVRQLQLDWKSLQTQCQESQKILANCITMWSQFTTAMESMKNWLDQFQKKVTDEQSKENKTPQDLERCKALVDEAVRQKPVLEELNDKCETLLELSACSWARDKTVQLQSAYTTLLTEAQGLVSKVEKNLSDHTEFLKARKEMEEWLQTAHGSIQDCVGVGDVTWARDKLETTRVVATRITEGQHLLSTLKNAFAKAINTALPEQQEQLRTDMAKLTSNWEQLNMDLNTVQAQVKATLTRWEDHAEVYERLKKWLSDTEKSLETLPDTKGEIGEMKTLLERYRHIQEEVKAKKTDLDQLLEESIELSGWAKNNATQDQANDLLSRWKSLGLLVDEQKRLVENEMDEYTMYHTALQETEKWLLQVSFQLMAHNSRYITSKEQTLEQIKAHDALLDDIRNYQHDLDDLKDKGQHQIDRYISANPNIKPTIETQLQNVQESYNSLLNTAIQIKNRLDESLAKFAEYERTLESIMKNLDTYEPEIVRELEAPLDTLESAEKSLESARMLHNKLQAEKTRLAVAVEACEAAAACVSRPGSPLDAPAIQIPSREIEVRTRLEDLIDQKDNRDTGDRLKALFRVIEEKGFLVKLNHMCEKMQTHLANVSKAVGELEEQAHQKNDLKAWINQQRALCAEWKSRPAKLRSEAAQAELQAMNELLGSIGERRSRALAELSLRPEDNIEEGLDKLETELMEAIADKQATQELIQKYRSQVQDIQSWFDGLSKKVDVIEKGNGLTIGQKISAVKAIISDFETQGPGRLDQVKKLGDQVMDSVSNLDSQQIEEQIKSVDRRYADVNKKLVRKSQVLDMTAQGIEATRKEIEDNREWISLKKQQARTTESLGFECKPADDRVLTLKAMLKEAENKQVIVDTLEKRVGNMQNELEASEQQELESKARALRTEQVELCSILREEISGATAAADARHKLETDFERARLWIKAKHNDLKKLSGYLPLRSTKVEQDIVHHNEIDSDINSFNENNLKDVLKQANSLMRDCNEGDRVKLQALLDNLNEDYDALKKEAAEKQASLADLLQGRKAFENEIDRCQRWIKEAETATSSDVRTSSVDVLREQLAKYDRLKQEAKAFGEDVEKIMQQGKSILPTVSDADKLELSDQLKSMKDAHNRVAGVINERAAALHKSIAEAEEAAARVAEAVQFMSDIQKELNNLNKPIGSRVEDVEGMLVAYEKILGDLKANKAKLSDLQSANIGDLHGVIGQQDDLIRALEAQIARLRQLLLLRQQFIALITEIMSFIAKYNEIVRDIEKQDQTTEEKIKRYDDVISKIQECEATLASATDKGQQIAADGSAVDRNNVTEQLQSLKQQLQGLRRAVEMQREQHELAAAEHKRLAEELAEILDWLENKEKEIKSRPLLDRAVESVESEIQKHKLLCGSVNEYLDRMRQLKESVKHEEGMPGSLKEMLSEAVSLLSSLPREMEDRETYLDSNLQMRLNYGQLADKFHNWVREAEIRLQSDKDGLDFENIVSDLEEHKIYFSSEASIRELVSQQIQQAADKVWPSLNSAEQEELSLEQQQHLQLLKNTLNTAKSHRARLEQGADTWRDYTQTLERVKAVIGRSRFTDEPVTTLAGLQFNIQKLTHALNDIQNQQFELDLLNERGQEILTLADANNKQTIKAHLEETSAQWKKLVSGLEGRREALEALSKHWEDLEARLNHTETKLNAIEERSKLVDCIVRSKHHIKDTIKSLDELVVEAEKLIPVTEEIKELAGPVIEYLSAFTEASARGLEERLDKLHSTAETLVSSLDIKSKKARQDLDLLKADEQEIKRLQDKLERVHEEIKIFYVFGVDQEAIEDSLIKQREFLLELIDEIKKFSGNTKARYQTSQQLVPSDLAQKLASLELSAEGAVQAMEEKQREQKRARTIRTDYLADVDELQAWIRQAELKVQDRSVEPLKLREFLRQIQTELTPMTDKCERMTKNGRTIIENTRDENEKEMIGKTIANLTEQLGQVKSWLEEKKQQVGDSLDAWQRFLVLYESVRAWTEEKRVFLKEPLKLSTLVQTRQRLHDYSTAVKSCKQVNKNLSDMGKELEVIGQFTSVGDLPEKLAQAEEAKVEVEGQLLERNALLQEASEEWEQCEKKFKDVKTWLEKAKQSLESAQNKKKPLRDQHAIREKMLSDIAIQKTKISFSVEKLQVHFKTGIGGDNKIAETADDMINELNLLNDTVKEQTASLESCLTQIDQYQQEIQQIRHQIIQVEQQLRSALSPTYLPNDRERAMQEQQIHREKIKSLQSKIQARSERSKLLIQRGTPDIEPLDP